MGVRTGDFSKPHVRYGLFMLVLLCFYAAWLFPLTVFDGFSTFSNDAGTYMLLAGQWSPFVEVTAAGIHTLPSQSYPPVFPGLLALTGAGASLAAAHLVVAICMIANIFLAALFVYRKLPGISATTLTLAFCLIPGVLVSSLGILSENLYLLFSLATLLLYSQIKEQRSVSTSRSILLWALLLLAILTRSIGIALALAIMLGPLVDRDIPGRLKFRVFLIAVAAVVASMLWGLFDPQSGDSTLSLAFKGLENRDDNVLSSLLQVAEANLVQIPLALNQYLSLGHPNPWFFLSTALLLAACAVGLVYRFFNRKVDAIYLLFYFGIILVWPYPEEMVRFLHPVVFLLILQAVFWLHDLGIHRDSMPEKAAATLVALVLIVNSTIIQKQLNVKREAIIETAPSLSHSYEFNLNPYSDMGTKYAIAYAGLMELMKDTATEIPESSTVASVKHEHFSVLSGRRAVKLVAIVSHEQQLCNLLVQGVDVVFLSRLTSYYNQVGIGLLQRYEKIASEILPTASADGTVDAYIMFVDRSKLEAEVAGASYECLGFRQYP